MLLQHSINNVAHATARPSPGRWLYLEQTLKQSDFNSCSHSQGVPTLQSTGNMCPHEAHTAMGHRGSGDHAAHLPQIVCPDIVGSSIHGNYTGEKWQQLWSSYHVSWVPLGWQQCTDFGYASLWPLAADGDQHLHPISPLWVIRISSLLFFSKTGYLVKLHTDVLGWVIWMPLA